MNTEEIHNAGYSSIFEYIDCQLEYSESFCKCFLLALGYTLTMPVLKNVLRVFYTLCEKVAENWNLEILKKSRISTDKYLALRTRYNEKEEILSELINDEKSVLNRKNDEVINLEKENLKLTKQGIENEDYIKRLFDKSILDGFWKKKYIDEYKNESNPINITIENGVYSSTGFSGEKNNPIVIRDYLYDTKRDDVFFILQDVKGDVYIYRLKVVNSETLSGTENSRNVVYEKVLPSLNVKN